MTKPTPEQIERACDLVNAERGASHWTPTDYGRAAYITILADTLAELDAMQASRDDWKKTADLANVITREVVAERDKARAELGEIDRLLEFPGTIRGRFTQARAIAAPYRVETDPLEYAIGDLVEKPKGYPFPGKVVSAFVVDGGQRFVVESELAPGMLHIFSGSQLTKRGLEIGRSA